MFPYSRDGRTIALYKWGKVRGLKLMKDLLINPRSLLAFYSHTLSMLSGII